MNNFFLSFENRAVNEIRYRNAVELGQVIDENMTHAHCMLITKGYKHTFVICKIYCFFLTPVFTQTHLNVTSYVRALSVLLFKYTNVSERLLTSAQCDI